MRYAEIIEKASTEKAQIDAKKQNADRMMKSAKIAKQQAKAADLRLKQKETSDALAKISRSE